MLTNGSPSGVRLHARRDSAFPRDGPAGRRLSHRYALLTGSDHSEHFVGAGDDLLSRCYLRGRLGCVHRATTRRSGTGRSRCIAAPCIRPRQARPDNPLGLRSVAGLSLAHRHYCVAGYPAGDGHPPGIASRLDAGRAPRANHHQRPEGTRTSANHVHLTTC